MNSRNALRLLILAAIWGASFLCMRVAVPSLGPIALMAARVGLAALMLGAVALASGKRFFPRGYWLDFWMVGAFNSAIPFVLFAWAAKTLNASTLSILNATAPIFGALWGIAWLRQVPSARASIGLVLGVVGVALVVGFDPSAQTRGGMLAYAAGLLAPCCYGLATNWMKSRPSGPNPVLATHGSMFAASLMLIPALPFAPPQAMPSPTAIAAVLVLGLVCTGYAYQMYFKLIQEVGATPALTVTFLIPVFGVFWGHVFLSEPIGHDTVLGAAIVILGTMLSTGFSPKALFTRKTA